jgi:hypothetical protein
MIVPTMNGLRARTPSRRQSQGAGGHRPGSPGRRTGTSNGRRNRAWYGLAQFGRAVRSGQDREGDRRSDRSATRNAMSDPKMVAAIDRGRFRAGGRCQPRSDARSLATGRTLTPQEITLSASRAATPAVHRGGAIRCAIAPCILAAQPWRSGQWPQQRGSMRREDHEGGILDAANAALTRGKRHRPGSRRSGRRGASDAPPHAPKMAL